MLLNINGVPQLILADAVVSQAQTQVHQGVGDHIWNWAGNTLDGVSRAADKFVSGEANFVMSPIVHMIKDGFKALITTLNIHSVDIISVSILGCAICMMVAPMWGDSSGKWFGRIMLIGVVGSVWRIALY